MTINLTPRLRLAADLIEQAGWVQGRERDKRGRVCLTGAIRFCAPQTGDEHLIRVVLRKRGRAEEWNDSDDRTAGEVIDFLRTSEVADSDLADTFGPQWREIVTLVRQAATLTVEQASTLSEAWAATRTATRTAAGTAVRTAVRDAVRDAAADAAWSAVRGATWDAMRRAAWGAVWDAALALCTRDLIGTNGYTQAHFDTLIGPWASVMGMPEAATS